MSAARPDGMARHDSAAPPVASLGRHYARYSSATVFIMLAGIISFPALTRLLDNTQYGILGYYDTWIMMAVAVIKLGAQHAILRLYPFGGGEAKLTHFATNLVFLPMIVSVAIWVLGVAALVIAGRWTGSLPTVLWLAIFAIPLMVFASQVEMTLRASERSRFLTVAKVSSRWLELAIVLGVVILIQRTATGVYAAKLACIGVVVVVYAFWVSRHLHFSRQAIDLQAYRNSLAYSLPLVANEIAGAALVSIDRIMLRHMLDDYAAVGIYTIGYALAMQLGVLVSAPLWDAFNPVANRIHGAEGAAGIRALKARVLLPATYACIGVGVAIWAIGGDALQMLSGVGKAASGPIFAWVGSMFSVVLLLDLTGYGLLLMKRTRTVLALMLVALAVNIALNLAWIPVYGYMGAAYATVAAYVLLGVTRILLCPRELLQAPEKRVLGIAMGAAVVFLIATELSGLRELASPWLRVAAGGLLWLTCYWVPVLALDRRIWRMAVSSCSGMKRSPER